MFMLLNSHHLLFKLLFLIGQGKSMILLFRYMGADSCICGFNGMCNGNLQILSPLNSSILIILKTGILVAVIEVSIILDVSSRYCYCLVTT